MKHSISHKFATMTALAAACTMLLATPSIAATDTGAVPSAVDSSKRVVRLAQSGSTTTQSAANTSTPQATQQMPLVPPTSTTVVYERGPIDSTGIDLSNNQLSGIPVPKAYVSDASFVATVLIPKTQGLSADKIDVSLLDDFIREISPNARHYPPNFVNRTQRHNAREKIKVLSAWIDPYASASNASYEVLLRAAKLNGMGRNLDLGTDFAVRGGKYIDRAIKLQSNSAEANFIYGMMLAEGGGFKEGQKYLDRAVGLGYTEAEQSLAQSDLLSDRRSEALSRLRRLEQQVADNTIIRQQIKIVEEGKYYIWDLPASTTANK